MINSLRSTTQKQYECYLKQFMTFTPKPMTEVNHIDLLKFLEHMFEKRKLGYSSLNTIRSAISTMMDLINNDPIGQHSAVKRFMKGIFNIKPSLPRYIDTWNPDIVISHLNHSSAELSLIDLSRKVTTLLALCSLQRISTLSNIKLNELIFTEDRLNIIITDLMKQSRPAYHMTHLTFNLFTDLPNICIVNQLKLYIDRTKDLRKSDNLFISSTSPHKAVSTDTLSNWIKTTLRAAGIQERFKAHSTRSAAVSKAYSKELNINDILKAGGWSTESTFRRFYNRPIMRSESSAVAAEAILK